MTWIRFCEFYLVLLDDEFLSRYTPTHLTLMAIELISKGNKCRR